MVLQEFLGEILSPTTSSWKEVVFVAALLPGIALVKAVVEYTSIYLIAWVGYRVVTDLRALTFDHLQRLSLSFYACHTPGELISRITNDTTMVQQAVSQVVADLVRQPVILMGALGYLIWNFLDLALVRMIVFPICIFPVVLLGRKVHKYSRQQQEHLAGLVSILQENISGAQVVKGFGMEASENLKFMTENERILISRFRTGSHSLAVELGRFSNTSGSNRLCACVHILKIQIP